MNKRIVYVIVVLLAFTLLGFSQSGVSQVLEGYQQSPEEKEIERTIKTAYQIESKAARNFDLTEFSTVFVNDPRFPMDADTLQVVREMTGDLSLETAGFLDYKMAYYSWWRDGALRLEALKEKAKEEKRELTKEEKQSLVDAYGRSAAPRLKTESGQRDVKVISIQVVNDIAYAIVNDGPRTVELTLVLVDNDWYIATGKVLSVHP